MATCYYRILGLPIRATADEIKRAFRMLALRFHPDRNPQDPRAADQFREALEAYETLVDPKRRRKYDRLRGYVRSRGRSGRVEEGLDGNSNESSFYGEVFEEYFGVHINEQRAFGGAPDLRFDLEIGRSSLIEGGSQDLEYIREVFCGACTGRGNGRKKVACESCGGKGLTEEHMTVKVFLSADCLDGCCVRVSGAGDRRERGWPAGDLVVYVHVVEGL